MSLSFADALLRFGRDLKPEHLEKAYRKAGQSFPLMSQHFVMLGDRRSVNATPRTGETQEEQPRGDLQGVKGEDQMTKNLVTE